MTQLITDKPLNIEQQWFQQHKITYTVVKNTKLLRKNKISTT